MKILHRVLAVVAVLFGIATVIAGTRVLSGSDPGYVVFRPLLIFNTAMGVAYLAAGVIAWRSVDKGKYAAATIFVLNLLVLGAMSYLYLAGNAVAVESVGAMILRTGVWLALFVGLAWLSRASHGSGRAPEAQPVSSSRAVE